MVKEKLIKEDKAKYRLKKYNKMNTDAVLYLTPKLLELVEEEAIQQIKNVTTLPGIVDNAYAMPDMHSGYGFPIGGVAAFDAKEGIISPGGIGFDINCGVRLLTTNTNISEIKPYKKEIIEKLFEKVPSGLGAESENRVDKSTLLEVAEKGIDWAIKEGIATKEDKESIEDYGKLNADVEFISERAIARGRKQIGTLGSGNHFLEIQIIEKIFDENIAKKWNLKENDISIMIHTGSRGFGHQIASDFIKVFLEGANKYNIELVDKQLASVPINSEEGQKYLKSMNAAANFAYVNRQMIMHIVRSTLMEYGIKTKLLYDVAHNIGKFESYKINGKIQKVFVHRKGATRAFSAGNPILPEKYISTGQPVLIPGSMGTASYIMVGTKAETLSLGSVAHGSGRTMSRSKALKNLSLEHVLKELEKNNVLVMSATKKGVIEEAPEAYKNVDDVINALIINDLAKPIARLKPLLVIKG